MMPNGLVLSLLPVTWFKLKNRKKKNHCHIIKLLILNMFWTYTIMELYLSVNRSLTSLEYIYISPYGD